MGDSLYGGTFTMFSKIASRFGIDVDFVNCMDLQKVSDSFRPNTKMVWVESASNPTLRLVDIEALSKMVKEKGNAFLAVDNTFMSSYFMVKSYFITIYSNVLISQCYDIFEKYIIL